MKMIILVPTRGRPENIVRLNEAFVKTHAEISALYCVDDDDPRLEDYIATGLPLEIGPRKRLVGTLNDVSEFFSDIYDIIGFLGDDTLPKTDRWDKEVVDNFIPNMVAYANDGWQREGLPTGVFLDSNIIRTLGYMVPPTFIHLFADNYWKALGEGLGTLTYLEHVDIEHLHPFAGKANSDATYEEANAGPIWENDQRAFNEYVKFHLAADVERLCQ